MSAAWFGLIGVIVGGVISTIWSWLSVVRQELTEAMVAARLIDEDLLAFAARSSATDRLPARPDADLWSANRNALAKVLGQAQWDAVAAVYRDEHDSAQVPAARDALRSLVQGKRYVIPQRWRNLFRSG
jgi:hypothetical protein